MRKWICYGIGLIHSMLMFIYVRHSLQGDPAPDLLFNIGILCVYLAMGLLIGNMLELLSMVVMWKPKDCARHELRLRWTLIGLYYECGRCGRHWLTRRSKHLTRLLGSLAAWLAVSLALTVSLPALLKGVMDFSDIISLLEILYSLLLVLFPALANYLTWRWLKDKSPQEHLGWQLSRISWP